ncbi:inactive tyrosine-protein kinase PEAK1 [Myripristis murdjan]|uniref:inactive tyrosine-protein kinase PEAK1 n=1 Tax=Myripristis murdjan TaxID=586833 RepID=UPI00117642A5|nr:inactive tyrosine-protein kinase PEAK1-like [Myripristis murdjan]
MEPGPGSSADTQPPALPVKQRRSQWSRESSLDSDCVMLSPVGSQHQHYAHNDVFSEPTDCHAAQCPIHQRYDHSRHQERFFSDGTPPPVPKKRLVRALSLPSADIPPPSPLFPVFHSHHQNFDNPLYMLAPIPDIQSHAEREDPLKKSPVPTLSLSQLSFDTPDEHLPYLFSSFGDQGVVSQGIQHCHLLFLRSMAESVEAGVLLQGESERNAGSYQPKDFLLSEGFKAKQIGNALYYRLHSPKFPKRVLGVRVHKWINGAPPAHASHQPSHVNVQEVIVHFPTDITLKNDCNMFKQDPMAASPPSPLDCTAAKLPCGGSAEFAKTQPDCENSNVPTVLSLLQMGHAVSIERDLPHITLEDFIQDSQSLQSAEASLYERQVCVLFLQIVKGLQHMCNSGATVVELRPQDIFLVWPRKERGEKTEGEIMTELEQDASERGEMERGVTKSKTEMEWEKVGWKKERVQMLWRAWGAPRVVLTSQPTYVSVPHPSASIKSQIGALLKRCLHPQDSLASLTEGSAAALAKSPHTRGLLYLTSWFQSETSGLQMADMVAVLQALLWGPHAPLFNSNYKDSSITTIIHNWLSIKRALLVMKLAERGLIQDRSVLDWEDCLCLQYLSFTDSETVLRAANRLGLTENEG